MKLSACAVLLASAAAAEAANILGVFWFIARSHFVMYEPIFRELAARGHNVTVLSHFPLRTPVPNYTDISIAGSLKTYEDDVSMEFVEEISGPLGIFYEWQSMVDMCYDVYKHPKMQELMRSQDHYDLVIAEIFYGDCLAALAHKFRAPLVGIISSMALPWAYDRVGNPDHPAFMESYIFPYSAPFTFWQRVHNTCWYVLMRMIDWWVAQRNVDCLASEAFGSDFPPTSQIVFNTSLILVNSHWTIGNPIPMVPAMVEVGGLHVKDPKPLPEDLQKFLDDSPQGVVYFSLGSMVRTDTFAPEKLQAVLDVFSELPQRILWKVDPARLPKLPPNAMARKWMPQNDILNHRHVRVFITHSGLMGTQEAVAAGVPMLCMPMFGDQFLNADRVVATGNGLKLLYQHLSHETLRTALHQLLNTTRYRDRAQQLSQLFRDRPRPPLQEAIYWTEYVLRHKGAPHLRSAALDLAWYQYLLIDVVAFLLAVASAAILMVYILIWKIVSCLRGPTIRTPKQKAS